MNIPPTSHITANPQAAFRALDANGVSVVLHLESGAYYELNTVGTEIWKTIGDGISFEGLLEKIRTAFPDAPAHVGKDVAAYVEALHERHLVLIDESGHQA